jgi:hypothetical protein
MLMKLMNENLLVLEEFIMTKTELADDLKHFSETYESSSFEVLVRVKAILEKIYRQYWPNESISEKGTHEKSFLSLL